MEKKSEVKMDRSITLGEAVLSFPESAEIFNLYKIDYCCGGDRTLGEALEELEKSGVNSEKLLEELNRKYESFLERREVVKDWRAEAPEKLIEHILETHHVYTKKTLGELDDMVFKILKVHFTDHGEELLQVHRHFGNLKVELEAHLIKEEEQLFPMMLEQRKTGSQSSLESIRAFIAETESEHDDAGDILKELETITRDFTPPEGACTTFKRAYITLDELEKDIFTHIHLENSVLFKMF